jgi:ATP-dependent exoDNAse (exonuclease V) alpha subunit
MIHRGQLPTEFNTTEALRLQEDQSRQAFEETFGHYVALHSVMNVQVIALTNESVKLLNEWAEAYLLKCGMLKKRNVIRLGREEYYPGKKIMFTQNNNAPDGYKNGELGEIRTIMNNPIRITLTSGKTVVVKDIQDICPGYATTCNKSQGSEWKDIIFWVCRKHVFFSREHAYVAVSRAKKHCHIMAERLSDLRALVSRQANRRMTLLSYLLEREDVDNLRDLRSFETVDLFNPAELKLLPKDCAAVPVYQRNDDDEYGGKTTKKDKRRKIANIFDTMAEFE